MRCNSDNTTRYNRDVIVGALQKIEHKWSLFGGEPLMLPLPQLEELLKISFDKFGSSGVQTNGTLITDAHIELFAKYNTHVGISMDGPGELNDSRWARSLETTREATERTEWAVAELCKRAVTTPSLLPSLIVTLHAGNAADERWPQFLDWLHELDDMGIKSFNIHVMEMDFNAKDLYLSQDILLSRLIDLWDLQSTFKQLRFFKFREVLDLLRGNDRNAVCIWHACDPWNTAAVQGMEGDGSPSHCGRTNKDGIDWLPAEGAGTKSVHPVNGFVGQRFHERQLSLYVTPQEHGGCKDCRFWMMCLGQCPGTGDASETEPRGDWRLRSSYCDIWKGLFTEGERRLLAVGEKPVSMWKNRQELEAKMFQSWAAGYEHGVTNVIDDASGKVPIVIDAHGHGDIPHGDRHGDHMDLNAK